MTPIGGREGIDEPGGVAVIPACHTRIVSDVVAERVYVPRAIRKMIWVTGESGHIPTQRNRNQRSVERQIYKQRNSAESFFNKLKRLRRIDTRSVKLARNDLAVVVLASIRIRIKSARPEASAILYKHPSIGTPRRAAHAFGTQCGHL